MHQKTLKNPITEQGNNSLLCWASLKAEICGRLDMSKESCFSGWWSFRQFPESFDQFPVAQQDLNLVWSLPYRVPKSLVLLSKKKIRIGKIYPKKNLRLYLPELFQFVDLLGCDLPGPELLLLRGNLHQPGKEAAVLDQGLPLGTVPVDVL